MCIKRPNQRIRLVPPLGASLKTKLELKQWSHWSGKVVIPNPPLSAEALKGGLGITTFPDQWDHCFNSSLVFKLAPKGGTRRILWLGPKSCALAMCYSS